MLMRKGGRHAVVDLCYQRFHFFQQIAVAENVFSFMREPHTKIRICQKYHLTERHTDGDVIDKLIFPVGK